MELRAALVQELAAIQGTGAFCVSGAEPASLVPLEVEGVGRISWPLLPVQAAALQAIAEAAPYGRGAETLVDASVRRSWQIEPARLDLGGDGYWEDTLAGIVEAAQEGLGIKGEIEAELYKLLLYEEGGFFVEHRDSEKAPGMFGTLVIVLPCSFAGGELVVRHQGEERVVPLQSEHLAELSWAAFYADCRHELRPVTAGHRIALVYNLVRRTREPWRAPSAMQVQEGVAKALRAWSAQDPNKLVLLLEHSYSQAELRWEALKGRDAGVAQAVREAAAAEFEVQLAQLSVLETAAAISSYDGYYSEDEDEEACDFEVGEIYDRTYRLISWHVPPGELPWPDGLSIEAEEEEIAPKETVEELAFDKQIFTEATGNAGATVERSYLRAALVIWPRERRPRLLRNLGRWQLWSCAAARFQVWEEQGEGRAEHPARLGALEMAEAALEYEGALSWRDDAAESWLLLGKLGEQRLLKRGVEVLWDSVPSPYYCHTLLAALAKADPPLWEEVVDAATLRLQAPQRLKNLLGWLPLVRGVPPGAVRHRLLEALLAALEHLSADQLFTHPKSLSRKEPPPPPRLADELGEVLTTLAAQVPAETAQATLRLLKRNLDRWEAIWSPLLKQLSTPALRSDAALDPLRSALGTGILGPLRARINAPLGPPPSDFALPPLLNARCCPLCGELSAFLVEPQLARWSRLGLVREHKHLMEQLTPYGLDIEAETVKEKARYRLIVTKTHGVYKALRVQRAQDLQQEAELMDLAEETP